MMWFLLLVFPVLVIAMGIWARSGKVTATDVHCSSLDLRLDRQAEAIVDGATPHATWMPAPRTVSRVAPRAVPSMVGELIAS